MDADDAVTAAGPAPAESADAPASAPSEASDDRAARRDAMRDLAAMIGAEVFY